jgi:beta-glucosidase
MNWNPCLRWTGAVARSIAIFIIFVTVAVVAVSQLPAAAQSASGNPVPARPWMNVQLSPDQRADLVVKEMTLDEKISLLHGTGMKDLSPMSPLATQSNGGAGYVVGIPRLGIPGIQMSDAAYGVRNSGENGRYSTALPDDLAGAASWDLDAAYEYGALIGRELRDQGYNMSLGGGVNLAREPRNGRTFEYMGEDPCLPARWLGRSSKDCRRNMCWAISSITR